jgi:ABC-type Na+ transport system ATPase subunit NatA
MLQPTSGTAHIGGHDICSGMAAIRESLGICPQFDILWPDISVREHLQLYAVIKGATYADAGTQARQAAAEVRDCSLCCDTTTTPCCDSDVCCCIVDNASPCLLTG